VPDDATVDVTPAAAAREVTAGYVRDLAVELGRASGQERL
jgi:hypothetical protein